MRVTLIRLFLRLCAWMPLPLNHLFGSLIGFILSISANQARRVTEINLALCLPHLDEAERKRLLRQSLIEMAKTATELGAVWLWPSSRLMRSIKQISGKEHLDHAMQHGKGVLLAAPHLGSWELIGQYCSSHYPMTSLYRPPRIAGLDSFIRNARERFGAILVPTNASGVRRLYHALDEHRLVAILPDQEPSSGTGVFAPFFGTPAYTMVLLARMTKKNAAPIVYAFAERLPAGRGYHLHFLPGPDLGNSTTMEEAASEMNKLIERCIDVAPAQYQWSYKRFRTRPPGEKELY